MKAKTFDCVEMKHRGAEKVREQIDGMTLEQELAFWQEQSMVLEWAALHQQELLENWNRCRRAESPAPIEPLE